MLARSFTALVALLPAAPAWAYVPPSQYIVKTWVAKRSHAKNLRIRTIATVMEGEQPTSTKVRTTTTFNAQTRELVSWASDESDKRLYTVTRKQRLLGGLNALLLDPEVREVVHALRSARIPIRGEDELLALPDENARRAAEVTDFVRWKSGFAWVIGDPKGWDAQFWIEKDTFLPARLVFQPKDYGSTVDVKFENYRFQQDFPYPRLVFVAGKESPIFLKDELVDVAVNVDAAQLKPPAGEKGPANGYTDAGGGASGSVRELIKNYYEIIR